MALEAIHIKFALDLKNKNKVVDLDAYLSGTIYPDSRYITEIDRALTHDAEIVLGLPQTDFNKGWLAHLLCDKIGNQIMDKQFWEYIPNGSGEDKWIVKTAIKIIQEMELLNIFDIQSYLSALDYTANPNGEQMEKIKYYNQLIKKMYKNKQNITVDDAKKMWLEFGIGEELAGRIEEKCQEFLKDVNLVKKIGEIYNKLLESAMTST